eukprot:jgi/Botrbrau1/17193/Bobra.0157s0082.1
MDGGGYLPAVNQPIKLWNNKTEQDKYDKHADLFAIIKMLEKLERAYIRDAVTAKDYEPACERLISQYKTLYETMRTLVPNVEKFMEQYQMQCSLAQIRLHQGMPSTKLHGVGTSGQPTSSAAAVAEAVQAFITSMDALKLGMVAMDQLLPLLKDLVQAMNKISHLPPDFSGKQKAVAWYTKLNPLPASYQLPDDDVRQLLHDLDSSYTDFMASIR